MWWLKPALTTAPSEGRAITQPCLDPLCSPRSARPAVAPAAWLSGSTTPPEFSHASAGASE
eukprot:1191894-Prorocentrum_minimum.AAC.2